MDRKTIGGLTIVNYGVVIYVKGYEHIRALEAYKVNDEPQKIEDVEICMDYNCLSHYYLEGQEKIEISIYFPRYNSMGMKPIVITNFYESAESTERYYRLQYGKNTSSRIKIGRAHV